MRLALEKGLANHPAVVQTTLDLLGAIVDRLDAIGRHLGWNREPEPKCELAVRDVLNDLVLAVEAEAREADELDGPESDSAHAMDWD